MNNENNLQNMRHSAAHLLAAAVLRLWPDTKLTIGPAIENGFYYDFDFTNPVSDSDLPKIEKKMVDTVKEWDKFTHREVSEQEAREFYKDNPYKLELIDEIVEKGEKITFYKCGRFEDLCRGGHSENPKEDIGAFKLVSIAGAYWRGSEKNKMLTRIYGTAFPTQKELDEHLEMLEEAKKRDHKKLGKELDLFMFDETAPGMTYWLPEGLTVYNTLYEFTRKMYKKYGYQEVATPQLNKKELYVTSGHWIHYKDDMFVSDMARQLTPASPPAEQGEATRERSDGERGENEVFGIKPMNCPNAMRIFGARTRSYNELPLRFAETTTLHRFELSGTLNGLFRTRMFRQDDAHIFLFGEQIKEEFQSLMKMISDMYSPFGLTYRLRFGTRPEKFMGDELDWDLAEKMLKEALEESGNDFFTAEGEGAFYGPKIDILMKDTLGREWQTGTIQLDFQQPKNFELEYVDSDGKKQRPMVVHRAIYGSFERFLGILIEHYAGKLPVWLSPIQVSLLPIADRHQEYAQKINHVLLDSGIRSVVDTRQESLKAKIRDATLQKRPFMGIIGDKEVESTELFISIRTREGEDLGQLPVIEFSKKVTEQIDKKV